MARLPHPLDAKAGSYQPAARNPNPESSPRYPLIIPGKVLPESGEAPALVAPRRRAHSEGELAARADNSSNSSASQIRSSASAENVRLAARSTHTAPPSNLHTSLAPSSGPKSREQVLLAATSLFLLSRDKLGQAWLRASDLNGLGRNLAPRPGSANYEHASQEFTHRKECLQTLVEMTRKTATGRKLLASLQTIADGSKNGDGKYVRPNQGGIKQERKREKNAPQDNLLTSEAERMINALHAQFYQDPLTPSLRLLLRTCDHLLVHWYQASRNNLQKPHERPELAFLDIARQKMMANVLMTYGLMKLMVEVKAPHASENISAVMGAAMRKLLASPRFASLLRRSELKMSDDLKPFVLSCQQQQLRFQAMVKVLDSQQVDARYHSNIWRWLNRVQSALELPLFAQAYFEKAALESGRPASFASCLKNLDAAAVAQWIVAATDAVIRDLYSKKINFNIPETAALIVAKDKASWLKDEGLREMMVGFE